MNLELLTAQAIEAFSVIEETTVEAIKAELRNGNEFYEECIYRLVCATVANDIIARR